MEDSYNAAVVLVSNGASMTMADVDCQTPLTLSQRLHNNKMSTLLKESILKPNQSPKQQKKERKSKKRSSAAASKTTNKTITSTKKRKRSNHHREPINTISDIETNFSETLPTKKLANEKSTNQHPKTDDMTDSLYEELKLPLLNDNTSQSTDLKSDYEADIMKYIPDIMTPPLSWTTTSPVSPSSSNNSDKSFNFSV